MQLPRLQMAIPTFKIPVETITSPYTKKYITIHLIQKIIKSNF